MSYSVVCDFSVKNITLYRDGVLYDKTLWEFEDGLAVKTETERPDTGEIFLSLSEYYASKNLKSEKLYVNGKLTNYNEYYDSPQNIAKYHFSYNTPYQTEESFYSETEVLLKREYTDYNENGTVIGKQKTECYDSGVVKLEERTQYSEEGKLERHEIFEYYENAQVKKHTQTEYENGIQISVTVHEYDENGNITNK
ncbi:MAG: hypothetical protein IJX55_00250 [Clostridia bacterium]|nr:hypothetical protein [Clostridia bacterium]